MPRNGSDDENDSCCLVGTPLIDLIPEDAKFSVKAKRPEEQIVTDERGRQRFHGAFTGGFSAGYFNSVGTKEGWTPSTFKSSKSEQKVDKKPSSQRPEDFMDEEDFSEHGIAPKTLKVKSDYKDYEPAAKKKLPADIGFNFDDMIKPTRSTLGVRMLKKMGWREGQGIGPRIKRKLRKLKTKIAHEPGRKIYGVALPSESDESELDEEQEDEYLVSTFDINEFQFEIKEDMFGLGYKRLNVGNLFGQESQTSAAAAGSSASIANLLFPTMADNGKKNAKSIAGQAFGVGDFEDDEDIDVYQQDSLNKYYFDLDSQKHQEAKKQLNKSYGFGAFEDDVSILKKFSQSQKKQQPAKVFAAPIIPPGFDLNHKFDRKFSTGAKDSADIGSNGQQLDDSMNVYLKSMSERAQMLGEKPLQVDSVFDLIKPTDREFLERQQQKQTQAAPEMETKKPAAELSKRDELERIAQEKKAKRYEEYVGYVKKNYKDPYSFVDTQNMTEWEKQQEKTEFQKRYDAQVKLLEVAKASNAKFVSSATLTAQNVEVSTQAPKDQAKVDEEKRENETEQDKAVREKKYGQATRVEYEWRPHNTLCKRFNVPNPYPDTKEYGTVKNETDKRLSKVQKLSVFDFLNAETRFDQKSKKSLFDELNQDRIVVEKPPEPQIDQNKLADVLKTEFESIRKGVIVDEPKKDSLAVEPDSSKAAETVEPVKIKFQFNKDEEEELEMTSDNIYLQERPAIDLFKTIFEDEDDEEEEAPVEPEPEPESEPEMEVEEEAVVEVKKPDASVKAKPTEVIASSIGGFNFKDVSRYLDKREDEEEENSDYLSVKTSQAQASSEPKILFRKKEPKVEKEPEAVRFSKLLKTLVSKTSTAGAEAKSSSDNDDDSSSSSSSASEEIVYEEFSVDNDENRSKKSSHKKKSSKKKSKKKHKKKSKKSKKAAKSS